MDEFWVEAFSLNIAFGYIVQDQQNDKTWSQISISLSYIM
jgi:hypothetical protein